MHYLFFKMKREMDRKACIAVVGMQRKKESGSDLSQSGLGSLILDSKHTLHMGAVLGRNSFGLVCSIITPYLTHIIHLTD